MISGYTFSFDTSHFSEATEDKEYNISYLNTVETLLKNRLMSNGFPILIKDVLQFLGCKKFDKNLLVYKYGWTDPYKLSVEVFDVGEVIIVVLANIKEIV